MISFASPGWLVLLLVLPLVVVARRRDRRGVRIPDAAGLAGGRTRGAVLASSIPLLLRLLTIALIVLALARPRTAGGIVESHREGVPIVIALDVSSSMLAADPGCGDPPCAPGEAGPTRLDVAKATISSFVAARPDDPVGLVAFAAEAITLVPVTTHQPLIRAALESARVGLVEDGTAIGEGLATAVNRLRRVPGEDRVIILMSDGAGNRGATDPLAAAAAAAAFGIRVHTIAIGSSAEQAAAPPPDSVAGVETVETAAAVDESLMREIARATGGEFHRASEPGALAGVYERIDRLERTPVERRDVVLHREWYLWLLALAAGALALESLARGSRWGPVP